MCLVACATLLGMFLFMACEPTSMQTFNPPGEVPMNSNTDCGACAQKKITKVLENELATIVYSGVPIQSEGVDSLAFVTELNNQETLYPCYGQVPMEYRKEGLKVRISGNVTNCGVSRYAPNARLLPAYIFELTSIAFENTDCASCENKQIIKVLKDEPGYIKNISFNSTDFRYFFVFEPIHRDPKLTIQLHVCSIVDLENYQIAATGKYVTISGNITNCLSEVIDYDPGCRCSVRYEYNILELSSIKEVEN